MRALILVLLSLIALPLLAINSDRRDATRSSQDELEQRRIRFHISTIAETRSERRTISEATVEGLPGTDFNINLQNERFRMSARFMTDLLNDDTLQFRARLNTRRLYGFSERRLPLYEEDAQSETLRLGFDEAIVLLPFGRNGGDQSLTIEITPAVSDRSALLPSGDLRPLEINILRPSPGGVVSIEAFKVPHRYVVEATLLEDGREVARGNGDCLLEEPRQIILQGVDEPSTRVTDNTLALGLSINQFIGGRPADRVRFTFDFYRLSNDQTKREFIGQNWSGIASLDSAATYDVTETYRLLSGKKYELRIAVRLAPGEQVD